MGSGQCSSLHQILHTDSEDLIGFLEHSNLYNSQGPTGEGADFGGLGGGTASLEHEPTTVRKLVFQGGKLYAGDVMGSLCRFWMFYQRLNQIIHNAMVPDGLRIFSSVR